MSITWQVKTELFNSATGLRKIVARVTNGTQSFSYRYKAIVDTPEQRAIVKAKFAAMWAIDKAKIQAGDPEGDALTADLQEMEA